tara:strand:+ start:8962 stop:9606 length:645 start_codon:yes stop_codon:yes gene_type:complete
MAKNIKNSPLNFIQGTIQALGAYDWGGKRQKEIDMLQGEYDEMKDRFTNFDTSNIYSSVSNPYANMENVMEDLTVNTQQADFIAQQNQQQQANVLDRLRGAVGSSGGAGLAQQLLNQGQLQTQQAAASIGQQESQNQMLAARQAGQIQSLERQGEWKADMTRRAGEEQSRALEKAKVNALLTMSTNRLGTAKSQHELAQEQMWSGIGSALNPLG